MTPEEQREFNGKFVKLLNADEGYTALMKENREHAAVMRKFQPRTTHRGNVWFFKGKAATRDTGN